jgi:mannose-6-phosphate isomerase-like protein (cupin superfamily)
MHVFLQRSQISRADSVLWYSPMYSCQPVAPPLRVVGGATSWPHSQSNTLEVTTGNAIEFIVHHSVTEIPRIVSGKVQSWVSSEHRHSSSDDTSQV